VRRAPWPQKAGPTLQKGRGTRKSEGEKQILRSPTAIFYRHKPKGDSSTSRPDGNREDTISGSKKLETLRSE
jgi:hypothetical protein